MTKVMSGKSATISGKPGSSGFIMMALLVIITAMGVLSSKVMLNVASEVQRDQEAELIFRGEAIARAIGSYKKLTGSYPIALADIVNIRPKIIRKLYKDPMTTSDPRHNGDWDLIISAKDTAVDGIGNQPASIVGVRSFCCRDSKKIYRGKDLVSDWLFVAVDAGDVDEMRRNS